MLRRESRYTLHHDIFLCDPL